MLTGNKLITPPVSEGCLNGVMRKQVLEFAKKNGPFGGGRRSDLAFDLQKSRRIIYHKRYQGIQPITKYRKKKNLMLS
jgi:branched-chain amino acid aminotransferase